MTDRLHSVTISNPAVAVVDAQLCLHRRSVRAQSPREIWGTNGEHQTTRNVECLIESGSISSDEHVCQNHTLNALKPLNFHPFRRKSVSMTIVASTLISDSRLTTYLSPKYFLPYPLLRFMEVEFYHWHSVYGSHWRWQCW